MRAPGTLITIDIGGRFRPGGTGQIEMTVTDDGRGFDTTRPTGNGLLDISDRIKCVQGSVWITSAGGHGIRFRAGIPPAANTLATFSRSPRMVVRPTDAPQVATTGIAGG